MTTSMHTKPPSPRSFEGEHTPKSGRTFLVWYLTDKVSAMANFRYPPGWYWSRNSVHQGPYFSSEDAYNEGMS